jgi:hypothetical protein
MIRADEVRKGNGQFEFSLTVLGTSQLRPKLKLSTANPVPLFTRKEIDLSGTQVLVRLSAALCAVGLLLWAIIRLWLFEYQGEQTDIAIRVNKSNRGPNLASAA